MHLRKSSRVVPLLLSGMCIVALTCLGPTPLSRVYHSEYDARIARASEQLSQQSVRIEIMEGTAEARFYSAQSIALRSSGRDHKLPPGEYRVRSRNIVPAKQRFHLFGKAFDLSEKDEQDRYIGSIQRDGFQARIVQMGKRYATASGTVLDSRVNWISIARFATLEEAEKAKQKLELRQIWTWPQAELLVSGRADLFIAGASGESYGPLSPPLSLSTVGALSLSADARSIESAPAYVGDVEISIGPGGKLSVHEVVALETYLRGVVPAEMPSLWPLEALKAQAVAARSEVLASLGTKHRLEGFDFCDFDHCRAYNGSHSAHERATQAVMLTRGQIVTRDHRIAPTVFSSNCGGWTEDNDTVWAGPPQASLRGVSDLSPTPAADPKKSSVRALADWIVHPPYAWCRGDETYFRWKRSYSNSALSDIVNARLKVGKIQQIELGERGVGGRLKWVRIHGSQDSVTVRKELPIRQAFGGLPSALFILDQGEGGEKSITFLGGGRGHGVGLCQYGARGMALQGANHAAILGHYYSGVTIERYQ